MKRTKIHDRTLPLYSLGEERMNMITHIAGGGIAIVIFALCLIKTIPEGGLKLITAITYGLVLLLVYTMSSIYHGLRPGTSKKVLQVLDHCAIYGLIAGTYTPIVLCAIAPQYPVIGWGLFGLEWFFAIIAVVLNAIDLKRYKVFSMICYIGMGWSIIFFLPQAMDVLSPKGFWLLFSGGIAYSIGAVLFGLGKRLKWMHSVFHIFVILGSILQFITIIGHVL